jgi:glycosyltransferase involved in cell wall biosynthesis
VIKVLLDFGNAGPTTGTGVYGRGLLNGLRTYCSERCEAREAGLSSVSTTLRPLRRLLYLSRLRDLRRKGFNGADVVHFTNVYAPARQSGVAYVVTIHDLDAILFPEVYTDRYTLYYSRSVTSSMERAHVVFTDTAAVRRMMLERYPVAPERVKVVGVGMSPGFMEAVDRRPVVQESRTPELLFVGRLEMKKNLEWLVETVGHGITIGALPRLHLVLAGGRGYGFPVIARAVKRNAEHVTWVNTPSVDALADCYVRSDVVILPSRCEGFGIPLVEAMYCRKPIVASRIPTSLEVTGGAAHFFDLDNADELYHALTEALAHREVDDHRAVYAQRLETYSWSAISREAAAAYVGAIDQV